MMVDALTVREKAVFTDDRGSHVKMFGVTPEKIHVEGFTVKEVFMTTNHVNVIRGMHFQVNPYQPKILSCITGQAWVNVVCLDKNSPNFLITSNFLLTGDLPTEEGKTMIVVPPHHALGYRILEEDTRMLYLAGSDFSPTGDVGIHPLDPDLALNWGPDFDLNELILSTRDKTLPSLEEFLGTVEEESKP